MKKTSQVVSLGNKLFFKYASISATSISDDVKTGLYNSIKNASGSHLMPFIKMLGDDNGQLSLDVYRDDGLFKSTLKVDNLIVRPFEISSKYQDLPAQVETYLKRFPELFTVYYQNSKVTYDNFKVTLTFP